MAADDFLGACYGKAMTPQKLWTLPSFSPIETLRIAHHNFMFLGHNACTSDFTGLLLLTYLSVALVLFSKVPLGPLFVLMRAGEVSP